MYEEKEVKKAEAILMEAVTQLKEAKRSMQMAMVEQENAKDIFEIVELEHENIIWARGKIILDKRYYNGLLTSLDKPLLPKEDLGVDVTSTKPFTRQELIDELKKLTDDETKALCLYQKSTNTFNIKEKQLDLANKLLEEKKEALSTAEFLIFYACDNWVTAKKRLEEKRLEEKRLEEKRCDEPL